MGWRGILSCNVDDRIASFPGYEIPKSNFKDEMT